MEKYIVEQNTVVLSLPVYEELKKNSEKPKEELEAIYSCFEIQEDTLNVDMDKMLKVIRYYKGCTRLFRNEFDNVSKIEGISKEKN